MSLTSMLKDCEVINVIRRHKGEFKIVGIVIVLIILGILLFGFTYEY